MAFVGHFLPCLAGTPHKGHCVLIASGALVNLGMFTQHSGGSPGFLCPWILTVQRPSPGPGVHLAPPGSHCRLLPGPLASLQAGVNLLGIWGGAAGTKRTFLAECLGQLRSRWGLGVGNSLQTFTSMFLCVSVENCEFTPMPPTLIQYHRIHLVFSRSIFLTLFFDSEKTGSHCHVYFI